MHAFIHTFIEKILINLCLTFMLFWFFPELVRAHWLHADASQGSFRGSTSLPVQVQVLEWRIQASCFRTASLLILIRYSNLRDELFNHELLVISCCFMLFVFESDVCIFIARTCSEFAKCIYKDAVSEWRVVFDKKHFVYVVQFENRCTLYLNSVVFKLVSTKC